MFSLFLILSPRFPAFIVRGEMSPCAGSRRRLQITPVISAAHTFCRELNLLQEDFTPLYFQVLQLLVQSGHHVLLRAHPESVQVAGGGGEFLMLDGGQLSASGVDVQAVDDLVLLADDLPEVLYPPLG